MSIQLWLGQIMWAGKKHKLMEYGWGDESGMICLLYCTEMEKTY